MVGENPVIWGGWDGRTVNGDALETSLANFEAVNSGNGGVAISNSGGLEIGDIGSTVGVSTAGGGINISVIAIPSGLVVYESLIDTAGGTITLTATDAEGDPFTFAVVVPPKFGT